MYERVVECRTVSHAQLAQYVPLFSPGLLACVVSRCWRLMLVNVAGCWRFTPCCAFGLCIKRRQGTVRRSIYIRGGCPPVALVECAAVSVTSGQCFGQSLLCRQRARNEKPAYRSRSAVLLLACWIGFVLISLIGGNGHHYIIQRQGAGSLVRKDKLVLPVWHYAGRVTHFRPHLALNLIRYSRRPMLA